MLLTFVTNHNITSGKYWKGFLFFFWSSVSFKWTQGILFLRVTQTRCEKWVARVWLHQKASSFYCLPSQLLQAPAPWLPYMRDQGLPRCFGGRRAQCEWGQTSPENTHFLCLFGGDSDEQIFILPSLLLMNTVASLWRALWPLPVTCCTVCGLLILWVWPKENLFRLLFIR